MRFQYMQVDPGLVRTNIDKKTLPGKLASIVWNV